MKRPHDNVGCIDRYTWQSEECLCEVSGMADGAKINYSGLARKYNLKNSKGNTPGNAGQIVKEFLVRNGIAVQKFSQINRTAGDNEVFQIRRKKRR